MADTDYQLEQYDDVVEEEETTTDSSIKTETKKDDVYVSVHAAGFKEFLLKPELLRAIADCGFEHPSEVQNECIPQAVLGTDVICQARSGMGKTAVFVLSTLQQIDPVDGQVDTLVLCHTRELAYQINKEFERFKKYMPQIRTAVFYGGVPVTKDREVLKANTPHVVIGTPGRVKQLVEDGDLKLNHLKRFILDECDKMLETTDMRAQVQQVFRATPHDKQVMMYSATLSDDVRSVCNKFMHNPLEIYVADQSKLTLHGLQQYYVELLENEKTRKLFDLLDTLQFNQCVIFVRSVSHANILNKLLVDGNFPSICIHSGMAQPERIERYKKFKEFKARIMVATDLFGRGIDIERVNVVINYDMAEDADSYLHRVGRAGRFGTKGLAISFVSSETDADVLNKVQQRFVVKIETLPAQIEASTYITS